MITYRIEVEETGNFDRRFASFLEHVQKMMKKTVQETCEAFEKQVKMNISLSAHGNVARPYDDGGHFEVLGRARVLGGYDHPFARRHTSIQEHDHEPIWGVHEVSGQMKELLGTTFFSEPYSEVGYVGWDESVIKTASPPYKYSPGYIIDIIKGTGKMFERPILQFTAMQMGLGMMFHDKMSENLEGLKWQMA